MRRRLSYWLGLVLLGGSLGAGPVPGKAGAAVGNVPPPNASVATDAGAGPASHTVLGEEPLRNSGGQSTATTEATPIVPSSGMDYPRVLAALGIVVGLIFLMRWCGRLVFPAAVGRGSNRAIEVVSRAALSPKQQVMLIRVGRRLIVVGDSGSQMNPLCEITDPDEMAALVGQLQGEKTVAAGSAFGSLFSRSRKHFESADEPMIETPAPLDDAEEQAPVATAREELSGLRDRVRLLAEQFRST